MILDLTRPSKRSKLEPTAIMNYKKNYILQAFSLLELSVVMIIMGLIFSGSVSAFQIGMKKAEIKMTNDNINSSYRAIGDFLQKNKRLPCPSNLSDAVESSDNYGLESRSTNANPSCTTGNGVFASGNLVYGAIPTRSLGIPDNHGIDGYGNKIAYIVDSRLTNNYIDSADLPSDLSSEATYGTIGDSSITVSEMLADGSNRQLQTDIAIVILSHGANMLGSFALNQTIQATMPISASELDNVINSTSNPSFDTNFTFRDLTKNSSFDDVVLFKSKPQITVDYGIEEIVACNGDDLDDSLFTSQEKKSLYYGETLSVPCPSPNKDSQKSVRCESYGKWGIVTQCPQAGVITTNCKFPASSDDSIAKGKVILNGNYSSQGHTYINGASTYFVWEMCSLAGTTLNNGSSITSCTNPIRLRATCNNGYISTIWNN